MPRPAAARRRGRARRRSAMAVDRVDHEERARRCRGRRAARAADGRAVLEAHADVRADPRAALGQHEARHLEPAVRWAGRVRRGRAAARATARPPSRRARRAPRRLDATDIASMQRGLAALDAQLVGRDRRWMSGPRPVRERELLCEPLALDVESRQHPVEPAPGSTTPPRPNSTSTAGISVIRTRKASIATPTARPNAIGWIDGVALGHERREHREHDDRGGGDDPRRPDEALVDGAARGSPGARSPRACGSTRNTS